MTNVTSIITFINLIVMLGTALGVVWAFRSGKNRSEQEIGDRVRAALHEENELLQARLKRVEGEYRHLTEMLQFIIDILQKTRGITMEIDTNNSIVTFRGGDGAIHVSRLPDEQANKKED